MHDIAQKQIFFLNYQSWIRIQIWWWTFRIRQKGPDPAKGPDPSGFGSATLLYSNVLGMGGAPRGVLGMVCSSPILGHPCLLMILGVPCACRPRPGVSSFRREHIQLSLFSMTVSDPQTSPHFWPPSLRLVLSRPCHLRIRVTMPEQLELILIGWKNI
jgi:hypothetical protein